MKKTITTIILALMAIAVANAQNELIDDWAGNGRYSGSNNTLAKAPKAVFFGDSITDGWAADYMGRQAFFEDNNFIGRGYSGQTTFQMLIRFRQDVIDLHPKYVVILAGTNDLAENLGPVDQRVVLGNIQDMCELARVNKIKPIICSILPAHQYHWRPQIHSISRIESMNIKLKEYAKQAHIPYVDYYSAMKDERGGLPYEYSEDGVHPTPKGYEVMESIVLPYLK